MNKELQNKTVVSIATTLDKFLKYERIWNSPKNTTIHCDFGYWNVVVMQLEMLLKSVVDKATYDSFTQEARLAMDSASVQIMSFESLHAIFSDKQISSALEEDLKGSEIANICALIRNMDKDTFMKRFKVIEMSSTDPVVTDVNGLDAITYSITSIIENSEPSIGGLLLILNALVIATDGKVESDLQTLKPLYREGLITGGAVSDICEDMNIEGLLANMFSDAVDSTTIVDAAYNYIIAVYDTISENDWVHQQLFYPGTEFTLAVPDDPKVPDMLVPIGEEFVKEDYAGEDNNYVNTERRDDIGNDRTAQGETGESVQLSTGSSEDGTEFIGESGCSESGEQKEDNAEAVISECSAQSEESQIGNDDSGRSDGESEESNGTEPVPDNNKDVLSVTSGENKDDALKIDQRDIDKQRALISDQLCAGMEAAASIVCSGKPNAKLAMLNCFRLMSCYLKQNMSPFEYMSMGVPTTQFLDAVFEDTIPNPVDIGEVLDMLSRTLMTRVTLKQTQVMMTKFSTYHMVYASTGPKTEFIGKYDTKSDKSVALINLILYVMDLEGAYKNLPDEYTPCTMLLSHDVCTDYKYFFTVVDTNTKVLSKYPGFKAVVDRLLELVAPCFDEELRLVMDETMFEPLPNVEVESVEQMERTPDMPNLSEMTEAARNK